MSLLVYKNYLAHHGIKGQKWGIRRFQNEDGSLTPEGRERYKNIVNKYQKNYKKWKNEKWSYYHGYGTGKTLANMQKHQIDSREFDDIKEEIKANYPPMGKNIEKLDKIKNEICEKKYDSWLQYAKTLSKSGPLDSVDENGYDGWDKIVNKIEEDVYSDSKFSKELNNIVKDTEEYHKERAYQVEKIAKDLGSAIDPKDIESGKNYVLQTLNGVLGQAKVPSSFSIEEDYREFIDNDIYDIAYDIEDDIKKK